MSRGRGPAGGEARGLASQGAVPKAGAGGRGAAVLFMPGTPKHSLAQLLSGPGIAHKAAAIAAAELGTVLEFPHGYVAGAGTLWA